MQTSKVAVKNSNLLAAVFFVAATVLFSAYTFLNDEKIQDLF
jgi:hypothetical protein